jgi:hypothetical protein
MSTNNNQNEIAKIRPALSLNLSDPAHLAALTHACTLSRGERSAVVKSNKKKDQRDLAFLAARELHEPARCAVLVAALMRRAGVAAESVNEASVRAIWTQRRLGPPIEKTLSLRDEERDGTADFVRLVVSRLADLKPHPDLDAFRLALEAFRHPSEPTGEERSIVSAAGDGNELVVVPTGDGFVLRVRAEDPTNNEFVAWESDADKGLWQEAIELLRSELRADMASRILIEPSFKGESIDGWTISKIPATQKHEVLIGEEATDDECECIAGLYRAMGGEKPWETDEMPLEVGPGEVVLVHARPYVHPQKSPEHVEAGRPILPSHIGELARLRDVLPSDLLAALREISELCEGMPGDPGRNVCAVERVRAVISTLDGMRGKGER